MIKTNYINFSKKKIKKKWRFWRLFRQFFLRNKKKINFPKIKLLKKKKQVIWSQVSVLYGKKIRNIAYKGHSSKFIFNKRFSNILCKLELRLNVILFRVCFVTKIIEANKLIKNKKIFVNNVVKHREYLLIKGDIVCFSNYSGIISQLIRYNKVFWDRFKWKKYKKLIKKKINLSFFLRKNSFVYNYLEVNYCYLSFILLRIPMLGEVLFRSKKQLLTTSLFKKIYFLY